MRKPRRVAQRSSALWRFPCTRWLGCCRALSDASPDSGSDVPAPTADPQGLLHDEMMALPLDRQVDAWLAALRADGYSSRQLEYRAGVLGRWAAGIAPPGGEAQVLAAFDWWRRGAEDAPP